MIADIDVTGVVVPDAPAILNPRSIRLHLVDGTPQGLAIAEIFNWSGLVLAAPRSRIAELVRRPEVARTGVYVLMGPDAERSGGFAVYIGMADNIADRLRYHLSRDEKDFFDRVAVVVGKDDLLTTTHVRFLESLLIQLVGGLDHIKLENANIPKFKRLPETDRLEVEYFLQQLRLVMPLLGFELFRQPLSSGAEEEQTRFTMSAAGASATAYETDDGFVVLRGSTARTGGSNTFPATYRALRDQLVQTGRLVEDPIRKLYQFAEQVPFSSPSSAAAVVAARSASGPLEWKVEETGQTYRDWRAQWLDEARPAGVPEGETRDCLRRSG